METKEQNTMSKKLIIILGAICLSGMLNTNQAQLNLGGGVFYGTYLNRPGLDIRLEYNVAEDLLLVPKLDFSLPKLAYGPTFLNEICLHAHYIVFKEDLLSLYPFAGLNIQNYIDFDSNPFDIDMGFGLGICAGVGGQLRISDGMSFFGEARYATGHYHQFMLTGGIILTRDTKSED